MYENVEDATHKRCNEIADGEDDIDLQQTHHNHLEGSFEGVRQGYQHDDGRNDVRKGTTYTLGEQDIIPLRLGLLDDLLYDGDNRIFDNKISDE